MGKIGSKIRRARLEKNYTQEYLAASLQIGTRAYQNIESNRAELTVNRLIEIAQLLDVMPTDLLMGGGQIILNSKDKLNSDFEEERKVYKEEILFLRELLKDKLTEK